MNKAQLNQLWDVIVAGGGPGGVNAAVAAARRGASVLLVERYGYLGGMATAGLINPFMPYIVQKTGQVMTTSVFNEILDRLESHGGLAKDRATFDDEQMKLVLDEMLADAGISATHEAHSSLRVMPVVAGIGEAAGIAAVLCAQGGIYTDEVDGQKVRELIGI